MCFPEPFCHCCVCQGKHCLMPHPGHSHSEPAMEQEVKQDVCEKCGEPFAIGDWPWCPHGTVTRNPQQELTHYYDMGLDADITSRSQRRALEKQLGVFARDFKSKGEENDRNDRVRMQQEQRNKERPSGRIYSR